MLTSTILRNKHQQEVFSLNIPDLLSFSYKPLILELFRSIGIIRTGYGFSTTQWNTIEPEKLTIYSILLNELPVKPINAIIKWDSVGITDIFFNEVEYGKVVGRYKIEKDGKCEKECVLNGINFVSLDYSHTNQSSFNFKPNYFSIQLFKK